jgi:hypothetical protein
MCGQREQVSHKTFVAYTVLILFDNYLSAFPAVGCLAHDPKPHVEAYLKNYRFYLLHANIFINELHYL